MGEFIACEITLTPTAPSVWDDFNARLNQRFVFHFTPLHATWVNQIELLFGIYARRVLRHAWEKFDLNESSSSCGRQRAPPPRKGKGARSGRRDRRGHRLTVVGMKAGVPLKGVARHCSGEERH